MKRSLFFVLLLSAGITCVSQTVPGSSLALPAVSPISKLPSLDIYMAIPIHDCGGGAGFNVLSNPLKLMEIDPKTPFEVRFGGEMYYAELNHKRLGVVPLTAPQTGDAKIRLSEGAFGLNAMARFSLNYSKRFTPYVDVFAGLRGFTANMSITPLKKQNGYEESTSKNLSSVGQFNYGATFGFIASINERVKFNAGLMFTYSEKRNELVNIKSASVNSGAINLGKKLTASDLVIAKVGLTFLIDDDGSSSSSGRCGGCGCLSTGIGGGGGLSNSVNFNIIPTK